MRTTLDIPDGLLAAAQRACGARTKTMTVVMAAYLSRRRRR